MLKPYDVEINGARTTVMLSDEDAKDRGLTVEQKQAPTPKNKARTARTKSE